MRSGEMTQQQKSFVKGAAILAGAGLIVKGIGVFFRVPLTQIIGTEGLGYYQFAYPIYSLFVTVATAGLPAALSKLIAEYAGAEDERAYSLFDSARRVFLLLGAAVAAVIFLCAPLIAEMQYADNAVFPIRAVAPAVFLTAVISAYRGYFQGYQNMTPTAVSQIIEQIGKLTIGLLFSYLFIIYTKRPEFGAMGALIGISCEECCALMYLALKAKTAAAKRHINPRVNDHADRADNLRKMGSIFRYAVPVTIGACILPGAVIVDSVTVSPLLQQNGLSVREAAAAYGILTGAVDPMINLPAVLSLSLSMSLIPSVAYSVSERQTDAVRKKTAFGIKIAVLIGLPAAAGYILFAHPILTLLFPSLGARECAQAVRLLQISAIGLFFVTLSQTLTGILQGLGKTMLPVYSVCAGLGVKAVSEWLLMARMGAGTDGAAVSTVLCFFVCAVLNLIFTVREIKFKYKVLNGIVKPIAATALMGIASVLIYRALREFGESAAVLICAAAGLVIYAVLVLRMRTLSAEELSSMPGGKRIIKLLRKEEREYEQNYSD